MVRPVERACELGFGTDSWNGGSPILFSVQKNKQTLSLLFLCIADEVVKLITTAESS